MNSLSSPHECELAACVQTPPVKQVLVEVEQVLVACNFLQLGCSVFLMLRLYRVTRTITKWTTMQARGVSDPDTKY